VRCFDGDAAPLGTHVANEGGNGSRDEGAARKPDNIKLVISFIVVDEKIVGFDNVVVYAPT
jgi:hypothetical protein